VVSNGLPSSSSHSPPRFPVEVVCVVPTRVACAGTFLEPDRLPELPLLFATGFRGGVYALLLPDDDCGDPSRELSTDCSSFLFFPFLFAEGVLAFPLFVPLSFAVAAEPVVGRGVPERDRGAGDLELLCPAEVPFRPTTGPFSPPSLSSPSLQLLRASNPPS
jgi:hypothetical protein